MVPRGLAASALAAVALAGCGGGDRAVATPEDGVRASVRAYLGALQGRQWTRACRLMTAAARRDLEDAAGAPCARALQAGAALTPDKLATAAREVPGADVRISGDAATVGPLADAPAPLRLRRVDGRWLIAG